MKILQSRWRQLHKKHFTATDNTLLDHTFNQFASHYAMRSRQYHNLNHILQCIQTLDELNIQNKHIETALFLHDVIYNPKSNTNEQDSAIYAQSLLTKLSLPQQDINTIASLITATDHQLDLQPDQPDHALIRDIDLTILGAPAHQYQNYAKQIRKEYKHVPQTQYTQGRSKVLNHFLDQPEIFQTLTIQQHCEHQARLNIMEELHQLTQAT